MRYAFAGTPEFGARVLGDLLEVLPPPVLVVTQPPRPAGRGRLPTRSPVALAVAAAGLPVLETEDINSSESIAALRDSGAAVLVVAAFGQLLRATLLGTFPCLNVHASMLPSYRGAAPIARALMDGASETGVCIMRMVEGLDEGPIALTARIPVEAWDDAGTLAETLARRGAQATAHVLAEMERGAVEWHEQTGPVSYAAKLSAAERRVDLTVSARRAHDHIRALNPGLGALVRLGDIEVKVEKAALPGDGPGLSECAAVSGRPGALRAAGGRLFVGCGTGCVELIRVRPSGKRAMGVAEFLRGYARKVMPEPAETQATGDRREGGEDERA